MVKFELVFFTSISWGVNPTELTTKTKGNFWLMIKENLPVESVDVPFVVFFMETLTAGSPSWFSPTIFPDNINAPFNCDFAIIGAIKIRNKIIFFILLDYGWLMGNKLPGR